jgi:hypothetical protein
MRDSIRITLLALAMILPAGIAAAAGPTDVTVLSDAQYFDKPSGLGKLLGTLEKGRRVAIWNCAEGWCEISGGYVKGESLDLAALPDGDPRKPGVVDVVGDDGDGGNTAKTDTTVYKVKGEDDEATNKYLSAGDKVTIVNCGGDNWCEISAPYQGYVWAVDLNHG